TAQAKYTSMMDLFRNQASALEPTLRGYALRLFWLLAFIQFAWAGIKLVLQGADFQQFTAEVVRQILFIGFFLTLLLLSTEWAGAIVRSFRTAADQAVTSAGGTGGISPTDIFVAGYNVAKRILSETSWWTPVQNQAMFLAALAILACFAWIAALLAVALVESYIVISASVLFMGFGGSTWTKDYALKVLSYAIGVGAKLFVMQIIVGIAETSVRTWADAYQNDNDNLFTLLGISLLIAILTKMIPDKVQALIAGVSPHSGNAIASTAGTVAGAGVAAAAVATGGVAAVGAAGKLAATQMAAQAAGGAGAPTGVAKAVQLTGMTMKNLGKEAMSDVGRRLGGQARHGTMGGRMASSMGDKAAEITKSMQKPQEPKPTAPPPEPGNGGNTIEPT
ncbi:P-type conjugative transfer protein TrbL, partial [Xanthomonas phaseoli]